jgi:hypothetical protein
MLTTVKVVYLIQAWKKRDETWIYIGILLGWGWWWFSCGCGGRGGGQVLHMYNINKKGNFVRGHRYFLTFAETHCPIMSLSGTITIL